MNSVSRVVLAALGAATLATASSAEYFIRPLIAHVDPDQDGYSSATGFGLAGGRYFGPKLQHELSVDLTFTKWEDSANMGSMGSVSAEEAHMPVLVHYKYHFALSDGPSPLRLYVGPGLGMTQTELDLRGTVTGLGTFADSDSNWNFTWAASVGIIFKLSPKVDLDFGYRYLHVKGSDYNLLGGTFEAEDGKASVFYGGVGFRF